MHCPFCGHEETKVTDSRLAAEGRQIRRRRECLQCGERFTTFETAELADGSWETGFICEPYGLAGAEDITRFGGWRAWLAQR